jgi:hypothetical protein
MVAPPIIEHLLDEERAQEALPSLRNLERSQEALTILRLNCNLRADLCKRLGGRLDVRFSSRLEPV